MHHIPGHLFIALQSAVQQGGYWLLFTVSILEGVPLIGSIIPGHSLIALAGFFAHSGFLNVWYVIILAFGGALLGDVFGFFLGKKYGYDTLLSFGKYFLLKKEHIDKARDLVTKHTGKSILLGRFNPVTRALMPFIVGASGIHIRRFWFYDFVGCFVWIVGTIVVGYFFGASYHIIVKVFGNFVVAAIILAILFVWGYRFVNTRAHIFRRYEFGTLVLVVISLFGFFITIQDIISAHSFTANLDVWVSLLVEHHLAPFVLIFRTISVILSPFMFAAIGSVFALYQLFLKRWSQAFLIVTSLGGGLFINGLLKFVVGRDRPENAFMYLTDYSFPSGHALAGAIFFYLCIYFFAKKFKHQVPRELFIVLCCSLIVLTAASRVFLNVHWFSDVWGGVMLGILWTGLMVLLTRFVHRILTPHVAKIS